MIRQLLCRSCGDSYHLDKRDKAMGFQMRKALVSCVVPVDHGVTVNGVFSPMANLVCDGCSHVITGEVAVAVTQWQFQKEGEPLQWEAEYGQVIPKAAAEMADKLKGQQQP